jgi:hypothetical protein
MDLFPEKRQNPRIETAIPIEVCSGKMPMVAHDLSTGGMQVTSSRPLWPGQLLRVRFRLPKTDQFICCTCRVAGLIDVPVGVGLSLTFMRLDPEAHRLIARWVGRRFLEAAA